MSNVLSDYVKLNAQKALRVAPAGLFRRATSYIVEEKINGNRVFLWSKRGKDGRLDIMLSTKHNGIYTENSVDASGKLLYTDLFADLSVEPDCILDCELIKATQSLYPFDILYFKGQDVRGKSLLERKAFLRQAINDSAHVHFLTGPLVESEAEADAIFESVVSRGGEGVMIKSNLPYTSPGSWFKRKNEDEDDVFVVGFGKGEKGETTYRVAEYEGGQVKEIGEVYSAVNGVDRDEIKLGTVLAVRFAYVEGERVFPGTIMRLRPDKIPVECVAQ